MTPTRHSIDIGGRTRTYLEVGEGDRVLLFLHGSMQSASVARRFTANTFDNLGVKVRYLDGVERHFNDARRNLPERTRELGVDDVAFVEALAGEETYACGFSNGGHMVLRVLHDTPGLLAGAATFAANLPTPDNLIDGLGTPEPTPFLTIHGTADPISPYEGGLVARGRGTVVSARETAEYFAFGATDPVREEIAPGVITETWGETQARLITVEGMGHVVPSPARTDARLGPNSDHIVAAEAVADFFGF
ncbi:hypothetical protein FHE74_08575 [Corynebacterium tapiri]|uniref:Phospholipase/carboxylesterase/thioesterase domain-containing protein n=1 Tax=Corynebacterium tapiri TaxID=1448266 RepID=A0A5C4U247_9CORY|nr:hypothetical protein FHE74_08575 [Corynebacterium tapiri]